MLALQGDFAKHQQAFTAAGISCREVRTAVDLDGLDGIALPGGESTTMLRLLEVTDLRRPLAAFLETHAAFATCAGLILLARVLTDGGRVPFSPLGVLDVEVERNAYGRQLDSFAAPLRLADGGEPFPGVFIRAPRLVEWGGGVEPIAWHGDQVVGVRQGPHVALAFHPELTNDLRLHRLFAAVCRQPAPCA